MTKQAIGQSGSLFLAARILSTLTMYSPMLIAKVTNR